MNTKYIKHRRIFAYLFLFFLAPAHVQKTYTLFTGKITCFLLGNIGGIYATYKHINNTKETNNAQKESESRTFLPFMISVVSDYPVIKNIIESADFQHIAESAKNQIKEK